MKKIKLVLDWFPNNIHAGFLISQKRGYYEEAGVEVDFNGHVHGVMEMEDADFVCGPQASMLELMAQGKDMLGIGQMTYKQDSGFVSLKEAGIERPRDLEGKRMTHWTPAWFHLVLGELVKKDGGDPSKIQMIEMDVEHPEEVLGETADAIWIYKNWEYYVMKAEGKECNFIEIAEYGHPYDYPTPAIAVRGDLWREDPELVKAFMLATERGYQAVVEEGTKVIPEIREMLPDVADEVLYDGLNHLLDYFLDPEGKWGNLDVEAWESLEKLFKDTEIYGTDYPEKTYVASFRD